MKAFAILAAALLCLGSLAAGPTAARAEDAHHGAEEHAPQGPVFVAIEPLVVPVIRGSEVRLTLVYVVQLEVADADAATQARAQMPRLRDAYLRALAGIADRSGADVTPDIEWVKRSLAAASNRVLGEHVVREVLVQRSFTRRS
jgi:flagellar basal body-associated protein FliL